MKRSTPIYPKANEIAAQAVLGAALGQLAAHQAHALTRIAIRAYLDGLKVTGEDIRGQHFGENTKAIARLKVGEAVDLVVTSSASHKLMRSARHLIANDDARWQTDTLSSGDLRVTRLADKGRRQPRAPSVITDLLVSMDVGESRLLPASFGSKSLTVHYKARARKRLDVETADWSRRLTTKGVRVTRTA